MVEVKSLISDNRRAFFKINKLYAYGKKASGNKDCLFFFFFFHARELLLYISDTFHYENKIVHSYVMGGRLKKVFEFVLETYAKKSELGFLAMASTVFEIFSINVSHF